MFSLATIEGGIKLVILAAILFVWFVRYDNIIKEFKEYKYPDWLRDFVGILKSLVLSCCNLLTRILSLLEL